MLVSKIDQIFSLPIVGNKYLVPSYAVLPSSYLRTGKDINYLPVLGPIHEDNIEGVHKFRDGINIHIDLRFFEMDMASPIGHIETDSFEYRIFVCLSSIMESGTTDKARRLFEKQCRERMACNDICPHQGTYMGNTPLKYDSLTGQPVRVCPSHGLVWNLWNNKLMKSCSPVDKSPNLSPNSEL